jgi:hypothetical protein
MKVIIDGVEYVPKKQIKSLLADAKVGDLCQRRDGKWVRLSHVIGNSVFKYPNPESNDETLQFICDETGDTKRWGKIDEADIISTEPLAPEGSAEWAWQTLMLCKIVSHPAEGIFHDTYYTKEGFIRCMAKTGWKLYKSEPFANVKVGDYLGLSNGKPVKVANVTTIANQHDMVIDTLDGKFWGYYWFSGKPICCANPPITRILKPEEVKVKISLEGTVEKRKDNRFAFNLVSGITNSAIHYDMLDPATADLVRELIAKQEEEK